MKKKFFVFAIAAMTVCLMGACGSKDGSKEKESTEKVADCEEAPVEEEDEVFQENTKEGVVEMLKSAYKDANVLFAPAEDGMEPNIDLFGQYSTKAFNELLRQVRATCAKLPSDNCFFEDENALWNFWGEGEVKPTNIEVDMDGDRSWTAEATYDLVHGDDSTIMVVSLVYEDGSWKIDDWLQRGMDGLSIVEQMKEFIENHAE